MAGKHYSEINWSTVLDTLSTNHLEFVVVGGAALALHGLPRTTLDIDIFIPATNNDFQILFTSLIDNLNLESEQSLFRNNSNTPELFLGQWFTFSSKDGNDLVDVFIAGSEEFNLLKSQSETIRIADNNIQIASLPELKRMKQKCGRPIDLADIVLIDEIMEL
jgi:uncharacterized nucleotidyltransferase DUF6036